MKSSDEELPLVVETDQGVPMLKLPALRGSWKQINCAQSIRVRTLALSWPKDVATRLCRIVDASWWIANREIVTTMKYKEPATYQMTDEEIAALDEERIQPIEMQPPEKRLGDAGAFAVSVSRSPSLAEAAVLAVLSRAYKGEMRDGLRKRTKLLVDQIEADVARDIAAIRKMIDDEK